MTPITIPKQNLLSSEVDELDEFRELACISRRRVFLHEKYDLGTVKTILCFIHLNIRLHNEQF